jgi:predicted PurR-regulated permease PerM
VTHGGEPPRRRSVRIEIAPRTVLLLLAAGAAVWLLIELWPILILLIIALLFVGTLHPLVFALEQRGLRRNHALALIFVGMVALLSAFLLVTVPPLVDQVARLAHEAPALRGRLVAWLQAHRLLAPLAGALRADATDSLILRAGNSLLGYSPQVIKIIGYSVTTLVLAFYILADAKRVAGALYAVVPRDYHLRLARILLNLETIVGGYMRGQLITSAVMMGFTFVLLTACHVDGALALAAFAGLTDVIPFVGGLLATTPAVVAATSQGVPAAIVVLGALVLYQEFESRVLVPRVYGRVLRLSGTTVILALLVGGTLLGILGALLALPIAAGLRMIVKELRVELPGDNTDDTSLRARDEQAERAYEERSAGSPPQEAAVIATELAQAIREADAATPEEAAEVPITGGQPHED